MKMGKGVWLEFGWSTFVAILIAAAILIPRLRAAGASQPSPWPPQVGKPYPDLDLFDRNGKTIRLSSFKGKVLFIEPVGMNCPACLAWSGAGRYGDFQGQKPQANVTAIEKMFPRYAGGIALSDPRIVHIQLLLFSVGMMPTTSEDAKAWATHFHMDRPNQVVLAGSALLLQPAYHQATYNLVPGFQLVDKEFILRSNSTSDNPKTNLWTELLPRVPRLVEEVPR